MPRTKVTEEEEHRRRVRVCINSHMELKGIAPEAAARIIRKDVRTFQRRLANPDQFLLSELRALSRYLGCPLSEICGEKISEEERLTKVVRKVIREVKGGQK